MNQREHIDAAAGLFLVLLCACWGFTQVTIKIAGQEGFPPVMQAAVRSAAAAGLLCLWILWRNGLGRLRELLTPDEALLPGLLIAVLFTGEFLCIYPGMQLTNASRGTLFLYTAPFWMAGGAHFLVPGERLTLRQMIGLLCAFGGVASAFADGIVHGVGRGMLAGDLLTAAGGAFWGLTTVVVKVSPRLRAIGPTKQLLYQLLGSVPLLFLAAVLVGQTDMGQASGLAWGMMAYQSTIVAFMSYLAWFWLIARYPAGRLGAFSFLTPIFGMLAGAIVLGEPLSAILVLALVLVAVGIWLVNTVPGGRGGLAGSRELAEAGRER